MRFLFFFLLFPDIVFAQEKPKRIEELFKDLPVEERIAKRTTLAKDINDGKEKGYDKKQTYVLFALNVKDNPGHGPSWHEWIKRVLASGYLGPFYYTPEVMAKVEPMIRIALNKVPDHPGIQLVKLKLNYIKRTENYLVKDALDKIRKRSDQLEFFDLLEMAQLYGAIKEPAKASEVFKLMEGKATTKYEQLLVYQGRGQSAISAQSWNDCADAFKKAEEIFPELMNIKLSVASCLAKARRFEEVLRYEGKIGD